VHFRVEFGVEAIFETQVVLERAHRIRVRHAVLLGEPDGVPFLER